MTDTAEPTTFDEAAEALGAAREAGQAVRIRGAGTKCSWGTAVGDADLELRTGSLDQVVEHNVGDLTAVLEAGVPLVRRPRRCSRPPVRCSRSIPPLGAGRAATVGGVVATGDSGPLRHRYGGVRDLVIGMTIALSDGTVARSGGKVIKNVAGYDLAKLLAGSFGTLGVILAVNVRLHPRPPAHATTLGASADPGTLQAAARALAAAPLEVDSLDVAWHGGRGGVLARLGGAEAQARAQRAAALLREAGLEDVDVIEDDTRLWSRQRAGQRSQSAAIVRVSGRPSALAAVLRSVESGGGTLVGRAALGTSYVELDPAAVARFRDELPAGCWSVLLDAPASSAGRWTRGERKTGHRSS